VFTTIITITIIINLYILRPDPIKLRTLSVPPSLSMSSHKFSIILINHWQFPITSIYPIKPHYFLNAANRQNISHVKFYSLYTASSELTASWSLENNDLCLWVVLGTDKENVVASDIVIALVFVYYKAQHGHAAKCLQTSIAERNDKSLFPH